MAALGPGKIHVRLRFIRLDTFDFYETTTRYLRALSIFRLLFKVIRTLLKTIRFRPAWAEHTRICRCSVAAKNFRGVSMPARRLFLRFKN